MRLSIGNALTRVASATEEELDWLWTYLSFEDTQADQKERAILAKVRASCEAKGYTEEETAARLAQVGVDDRIRLFKRKGRVFPTGLLPLVRRGAEHRFTLEEVDARDPLPEVDLEGLDDEPLTLRPYQLDCVKAALTGPHGPPDAGRFSSYLAKHADPGRGLLWAPTGAGKSRMAVALAQRVPGHTVFLVHRGHLADDVKGRWDSTVAGLEGSAAGLIGGGGWEEGQRLTCATLQTLYEARKSERFKALAARTTQVIVDEAHVAPAETFHRVIMSFGAARFRIGLSGTPLARGDRKGLVAVGALGPVVWRVYATELMEQGYLAPPTVKVIPCYQRSALARTYREAYTELVVRSAHRNAAVARAAILAEKPGIVFVTSLEHGRNLRKFLARQGLTVDFVSGKSSLEQRKRAIRDLTDARLDLLVATNVFNEGVDIPDLRSVVMAAGGKSEIAALQRVGRALRPAEGKTAATVYEIGDKGNKWLHEHARARFRSYTREGYAVEVDGSVWPERHSAGLALSEDWQNLF